MAMAMASSTAAAVARLRIGSISAVGTSSGAAASRCRWVRSSFTGLSVRAWQTGRQGADLRLSVPAKSDVPVPTTTTTRKPAFSVVAKLKLKTHKAAAKRFRVTGSGKIMRRQAFKQHLLSKKSSKRKNRLSKVVQVNRRDYDNVVGALPYLKVKGRET